MTRRLRVLMTGDTVGGVWTYALDLADALGRRRVEVLLATMGGAPSPAQAAEAASVAGLRLEASDYTLEWCPGPWRDGGASAAWLLELARRFRPDLVQVNGYAHAALPFGVPVVLVAHSCVCSWWRAVHRVEAPRDWDAYRERVAAGLRAAEVVVAPTRAILEQVLACYAPAAAPAATCVIANGRRTAGFAPAAGAATSRQLVLGAGRLWDEAKNLAALDAVAGELGWPVALAGSTSPPGGSRPARFRVRHLGELGAAELAAWMAQAGIFCAPARYEPFGLAILEAALSGCALVLGDLETLREVWGDAAIFVDPDNTAGLARALGELITDPARRRRLARRARSRALRLDAAAMGAGYRVLYDRVLEHAQSRAQRRAS